VIIGQRILQDIPDDRRARQPAFGLPCLLFFTRRSYFGTRHSSFFICFPHCSFVKKRFPAFQINLFLYQQESAAHICKNIAFLPESGLFCGGGILP
jgi:hypothetical protein